MTPIPRPVRRELVWFALPVLAVPLALYAATKGEGLLPFVTVFGALAFTGQTVFCVRIARLRRRLRDAAGQLCPGCGYDLRGNPDGDPCPECGRPFNAMPDKTAWRVYAGCDRSIGARQWERGTGLTEPAESDQCPLAGAQV